MKKKKIAFKMFLKKGNAEEYFRRHAEIWPALKSLLSYHGISNYSIFLDDDGETLFAYQEVDRVGSQELALQKIVQQWWAYMADIMLCNPDNSPITVPLSKIFYME
ncbi:L-rhamnose mutarotase [Sphingobacteriaceae bacterium WQ 2009]|uniref:L-rhamnose mutarotase n=1 Tax=Rhinopithecimicrobium faecis TaxID=2820698 RepID=A0A8T4H5E3_9SPHI|nr:L-rhamnose mutarotase [Sphingobacteriaceae bacterium WQ 2009]